MNFLQLAPLLLTLAAADPEARPVSAATMVTFQDDGGGGGGLPAVQDTPAHSLATWLEARYPGYRALPAEERAIKILEFVATSADSAFDGGFVTNSRPVWAQSTQFAQWPSDMQIMAFLRNFPGGGLDCNGLAGVLSLVIMDLEGWPVWRVEMLDGAAAHTIVLVEAQPGRVLALDPLFGHYLADRNGAPMALDAVVQALQARRHERIQFAQPSPFSRELWTSRGVNMSIALSASADCESVNRLGLAEDLQLCRIPNWSSSSLGDDTTYGRAVLQYLSNAQLPADRRYMLLTGRVLTETLTVRRATPQARAQVAALMSASRLIR